MDKHAANADEARVLVLAPTGRDGALLAATLAKVDVPTFVCADIGALRTAFAAGAGALLLAEEALDASARRTLTAMLEAQPAWSDVPVILSTVGGERSVARGAHLDAIRGATNLSILERPVRKSTLVATVRAALNARARQYELRNLTVEIEHERYKLRSLVMQAPLPIAILEGDEFCVTIANPAFLDLVPGREVLGLPCVDVFPDLAGTDRLAEMRRVYELGISVDVPEYPQRFVDEDGNAYDRYFRSSFRPLYDWGGNTIGIVVVHTELTAEVLARSEALAANRAKDDFMAILGHELRNPLAPILTALELMRAAETDTFARERAIIERQANHMARLVEDLLDVSRIASGKVELKTERIEIAEVLDKAIETTMPLLEEARHEIALAVPRRGLIVDGDVARLMQIFSNLLTNAGKYSDAGTPIHVEATTADGMLVVQVTDAGRGIAADMVPRVFELFVQERQNLDRSRGGLGLGLSIVKSLTELHGGRAEVTSPGPGKGSTFTIRLPLAVAVDEPTKSPTPQPFPSPVARADGERPKILIVDDNEDAATLLAALLERKGFATAVAFHGKDALAGATDSVPQKAFLDIGLPEMDGYELCRQLRALPGWAGVELIALTGYGQPGDREQAALAGFDRHLVKPLDGRTLTQVLGGGEIGLVKKLD